MARVLFLIAYVFIFSISSFSQVTGTSQWAAMMKGGEKLPAVYGVKGVPSATNRPGSRRGAVSWTDTSGKFWMYGGYGYTADTTKLRDLNCLWHYNVTTDQWTWKSGSDTGSQKATFGTMGVPSINNTPAFHSNAQWIDAQNNLWLLGSSVVMWKYSIATNEWTWVKGDTTSGVVFSNYGVKGMGTAATEPGNRSGTRSWVDPSGKFWLFGGSGNANSSGGNLNDLWKFDPATLIWTWMAGDSTPNKSSTFGSKGFAAPANTPGARYGSASWADNNGNLWLFGGYGRAFFPAGGIYGNFYLSDFWKFSVATNQWTWVSGDTTTGFNQFSVYNTKGTPNASTKPGIRGEPFCAIEPSGDFIMFGGWGSSSSEAVVMLNDLFRYSPATNLWTWLGGDITGTKLTSNATKPGVPHPDLKVGTRWDGLMWVDKYYNIYVFGGQGTSASSNSDSFFGDMWKLSGGPVYTFIGNGSWQTASNWRNNLIPPNPVPPGSHVVIDISGGSTCIYSGSITFSNGARLTVPSGAIINIANLIMQ